MSDEDQSKLARAQAQGHGGNRLGLARDVCRTIAEAVLERRTEVLRSGERGGQGILILRTGMPKSASKGGSHLTHLIGYDVLQVGNHLPCAWVISNEPDVSSANRGSALLIKVVKGKRRTPYLI